VAAKAELLAFSRQRREPLSSNDDAGGIAEAELARDVRPVLEKFQQGSEL